MNGITNAQQQQGGGGGGGAASYTKIESTIAKTAWTDNTPSWIGQNVLTWTLKGDFHHIQGGTEDLGLVEGGSYTTIVTIDGTDYEQSESSVMSDNDSGMTAYLAYFNDYYVIMQIVDHCAGLDENGRPVPGDGYFVMVAVEGTPSSVIIKSCSAASGGKEAIINNSAIKTNSAVTMYVDYDGKISAVKKIDGSLTVSVSTMPTADISYAIEIVDTNIEGLFEVINNNFPLVQKVPASLPQKTGAIKTGMLLKGENSVQVNDSDITATSDIVVIVSYKKELTGEFAPGVFALSLPGYEEADRDISFEYKVKQTDGTGQFIVVNNYIPSVSDMVLLKTITNTSTNVYIAGDASPYKFTVTDNAVTASKFVRLYPNDTDTETWLNTHTVSSIITENNGSFTFNVDTDRLPSAFSIKYMIESLQ